MSRIFFYNLVSPLNIPKIKIHNILKLLYIKLEEFIIKEKVYVGGPMLEGWFLWFILLWILILISSFAIGGYFMFRKFLKRFPKADGKSDMDWEEYYIEETLHMWTPEEKELLEELVNPVPELFRDVARQKIAGKIGELAIKEQASSINKNMVIRGYIIATPKRDHKFLKKKLLEKNIDYQTYHHLF